MKNNSFFLFGEENEYKQWKKKREKRGGEYNTTPLPCLLIAAENNKNIHLIRNFDFQFKKLD